MPNPQPTAPRDSNARGGLIGLLSTYHLFSLATLAIVLAQPWSGERAVYGLGMLAITATAILVAATGRLQPKRRGLGLLLYVPTAAVLVAGGALHQMREAGAAPGPLPLYALFASALSLLPLVTVGGEERPEQSNSD